MTATLTDRPLPPGRGALIRRLFADDRLILMGGPVLLMQVAHPVVGAGVAEHSDFKHAPWKRLNATLSSVTKIVFGSPQTALAESDRLRSYHTAIKGVDAKGRRYSALNPEAYAWVHITLFWGAVEGHALFDRPLTEAEIALAWNEWRQVGRVLGIAEKLLPADVAAYRAYIDQMVRDVLEDNTAVQDVFQAATAPKRPVLLPSPMWGLFVRFGGGLNRVIMLHALPPELRERIGLPELTADERAQLRRWRVAIKRTFALVPPPLRGFPYVYLESRRTRTA